MGAIPAPALKDLLKNPYFILTAEELPPVSLVRLVRSAVQFPSLSDARIQYERVVEAQDRHGRSGRFLLTDLRLAPGRSDPGFEAMMAELRPRMTRGYRRQGVLTQTASGTLQVSRHARQDGNEMLISDKEAEILAFFRILAKMSR